MRARTRLLVLDQAVGLWGAQAYLLRMAPRLAERGMEMVLAGPADLDLGRQWISSGLAHMDVPLPTVRSVRADGHRGRLSARAMAREVAQTARTRRLIQQAVRSSGCDAVHANGHAVHLDAVLGASATGRPVILHLHEEMPHHFGRMLRTSAVMMAAASVAVSRAVADGLAKVPRRRVTVIPNGVDTAEFRPGEARPGLRAELGARPGDVLYVALTRLDPDKRIEDIVSAFGALRNRDGWHLAIVGSTSSYPGYAEDVRGRAAELLGDRVTFAGRRPDVADILRASDVLVHAGLIEGMPLGMIEAQACGIPVIGYDVAGVPEAVLHDRTGLLAPPGDVARLSRHVEALLRDGARRAAFGLAGRAHVEAGHTIEGQIDRYAGLIQDVVARYGLTGAGSPR